MHEDFYHRWNFRGVPELFRKRHAVEVRGAGSDEWQVATLTERRPDGTYEARVVMHDVLGIKEEVDLVGVPAVHIRDRLTKEPLRVRTRTMILEVPRVAPHEATLKVFREGADLRFDGIDFAHFLGRWTPGMGAHCDAVPSSALGSERVPRPVASPSIQIRISKNALGGGTVAANVGHSVLTHFMSGEVCSVDAGRSYQSVAVGALRKTWTLQVGPFAEHTIELERRHRLSKVVTVSVDGRKLAESPACGLDAGVAADAWTCDFRLVGDKFLNFALEDAYSVAEQAQMRLEKSLLPTYERSAFPDAVSTSMRDTHRCQIVMKDLASLGDASLLVDGTDFLSLRPKLAPPAEENVKIAVVSGLEEVLRRTYGVVVPPRASNTVTESVLEGQAAGAALVEHLVEKLPTLLPTREGLALATAEVREGLTRATAHGMEAASHWHLGLRGLFGASLVFRRSPPRLLTRLSSRQLRSLVGRAPKSSSPGLPGVPKCEAAPSPVFCRPPSPVVCRLRHATLGSEG